MYRFQSVTKLLCSKELGLQEGMLVRLKSVLDALLGTESLEAEAPEEGAGRSRRQDAVFNRVWLSALNVWGAHPIPGGIARSVSVL